jgi:hypothetical protein
VESGNRILRVQVKSTLYHRPGTTFYALALHRANNQPYAKDAIDFFVAYVIPADAWYIVPFHEAEGKKNDHAFQPSRKVRETQKIPRSLGLVAGRKSPPLAQRTR